MNDLINFLKTRRSVLIKNLSNDDILESDLKDILECGLRVPDHGILSPWKIKVIKGKSRETLGNEVLAKEYLEVSRFWNKSLTFSQVKLLCSFNTGHHHHPARAE